jgi:hypothetical protein
LKISISTSESLVILEELKKILAALVEAVLAAIDKEFDPNALDYDGDLPKLYKRMQKHFESLARKPEDQQQLETDADRFHQHHRGTIRPQ